jgi:glycosyltransferase involved in cell wall biosynthesis
VVHAQASKAAALAGPIRGPWRRVATVHGLKRWTWMFRGYDRVIAVSAAAAERLGRIPSLVVRNGIEPPSPPAGPCDRDWLRREMGLEARAAGPVAVAIGRLAPVKGFDVLLRAWRSVEADLALVGDGPERGSLEALAASLGLTPRVRFLGLRRDVPRVLCAADLMVISSRREGLPYVLLEALHLARPVVATRTPGVAELLPVEALCPPDDPAALAQAIRQALADLPAARRRLAPAWALARRELTREAMVRGVEAVYAQLFAAG